MSADCVRISGFWVRRPHAEPIGALPLNHLPDPVPPCIQTLATPLSYTVAQM